MENGKGKRSNCQRKSRISFSNVRKSHNTWSLREKKAFVEAVKKYGIESKQILANAVETKSVTDVENFLAKWTVKLQREVKKEVKTEVVEEHAIETCKRQALTPADFAHLVTPIEYWSYAIQLFVKPKNRSADYSFIFHEIMSKGLEKETWAQRFKVDQLCIKDLYEYVSSALAEKEVPELSPMNYLLLLHLIQEITYMIRDNESCAEEYNFMRGLHGRTTFAHIKTEDDDSSLSESDESNVDEIPSDATNVVFLSKHLFNLLASNKKVIDNLNPFFISMPLLEKQQEREREQDDME